MDVAACRDRLSFICDGNLNNESRRAPQPLNFSLSLKQHQLTMLHAMHELEKQNTKLQNTNFTLQSNVGIIADTTGAGKSIEILAHIVANPTVAVSHKIVQNFGAMIFVKHEHEESETIQSNLIVVPHSCVVQWNEYVLQHTKLTTATITKRKDIEFYHNSMKSGKIHNDIVICSNSMYNEFIDINVRWARVIFDEADSINIRAAKEPRSNFTWLWHI